MCLRKSMGLPLVSFTADSKSARLVLGNLLVSPLAIVVLVRTSIMSRCIFLSVRFP